MTTSCQTLVAALDNSSIGEARRVAVEFAEVAKLGETEKGRVAIVVTELARNLVMHAQKGVLLLRVFNNLTDKGIEILAIDSGPGMANAERCLQDGFSTAGTPGTGLGAVRRLSAVFDMYSSQPGGTVILSRIVPSSNAYEKSAEPFEWGVVCLPAPGEQVCGDCWQVAKKDGLISILVVDGLGHGVPAAQAADLAITAFAAEPMDHPKIIIERMHASVGASRGAAAAIAQIDTGNGKLQYMGVGNIAGVLLGAGERRGLCSHNGTVGVVMQKLQPFDYPWSDNGMLIMHSDGLNSRWDLKDYAGLMAHHPAIIAGVLYRDGYRGRDDVTVLVGRSRHSEN